MRGSTTKIVGVMWDGTKKVVGVIRDSTTKVASVMQDSTTKVVGASPAAHMLLAGGQCAELAAHEALPDRDVHEVGVERSSAFCLAKVQQQKGL